MALTRKRILIMGLPGSGKTTLAKKLHSQLPDSEWFNADEIRKNVNDWDFSIEGRMRQSHRLRDLANTSPSKYVIVDFVCPLPAMREIFAPDYLIWMDTIAAGRYQDTNQLFVPPEKYDLRVSSFDSDLWSQYIVSSLLA